MKFNTIPIQRYIKYSQFKNIINSLSEGNIINIIGGLYTAGPRMEDNVLDIEVTCRLHDDPYPRQLFDRQSKVFSYFITNDERRRILRIMRATVN